MIALSFVYDGAPGSVVTGDHAADTASACGASSASEANSSTLSIIGSAGDIIFFVIRRNAGNVAPSLFGV